jgi:DNA adenine methylase
MLTRLKARPFVKWAGGKQALAAELIRAFPSSFKTYYEPFLGGGSVFFSLGPARAVLGDSNEWLMETYKAIRNHHAKVADCLDTLENTREAYLHLRGIDHSALKVVPKAANFIYLNKTCFRGLFRVNRRGQFNVPYGDYQRRYYDRGELEVASVVLKDVELRSGDFESTISDASSGDFIYFDPPYYKIGGYSDFNRYTPDQFRQTDHERLADVCRKLEKRGVLWAVSNSDTELVRSLFAGFSIRAVKARREINLSSAKRDIDELLITNY